MKESNFRFRKPFAAGGVPTEHAEQKAVIVWATAQCNMGRMPELRNLFAVPNGGHRSATTAALLKAEGVCPGVPDLFLAWPARGYNGLFLEMKRVKGGTVSKAQKEWADRLVGAGYSVRVCRGAQAAIDALRDYLTPACVCEEDDE